MTWGELFAKMECFFSEEQLERPVRINVMDGPFEELTLSEEASEDMYHCDEDCLQEMKEYTDPSIADEPMTEKEFHEAFGEPVIKKGDRFFVPAVNSIKNEDESTPEAQKSDQISSKEELKAGDVVSLKSGGCLLTISQIKDCAGMRNVAECYFMKDLANGDARILHIDIPVIALMKTS